MALIKVKERGRETVNLGRRNLVINGAMQVAQRGTDINDIANDSTYIMDRFCTRNYGGNGTYDYDQSANVPTATFKNSLKLTCKSASTNTGTAGYSIEQRIEGYNIRQLRLGRSNAQPITVSFWVKSSVAGTYSTGMRTTSAEYSYVTEFTLLADTWTYVTYTAPALTNSLSSLNEESGGSGILLDLIGLGKQTNKETSTLNAWQSGNKVNSSNQVAWMDSVNATLNVTGVQVEAGDTATEFEHRSYGEELSLCQRYCYVYKHVAGSYGGLITAANAYATTSIQGGARLPVTMRAKPTLSFTGNIQVSEGSSTTNSSATATTGNGSTVDQLHFWVGNFSGLTAHRNYFGNMQTAGNTFTASAEL